MKTPEEMTDAELNEAVAVEVCGHWFFSYNGRCYTEKPHELLNALQGGWNLPPYSTSADAVLPLLEKAKTYDVDYMSSEIDDDPDHYRIRVDTIAGCAPSFPRAACIALLKAARAKKEGR